MLSKDFAKVAELYCSSIPTFTSFSVFPFTDLVKYATISGIMYLPRAEVKQRLVQVSDVELALREMPVLAGLLHSFDNCQYHTFFECLLQLEGVLALDPYLRQHAATIIGVLRLRAYQQFLDSFKWWESEVGLRVAALYSRWLIVSACRYSLLTASCHGSSLKDRSTQRSIE